MGSLLLDTFLDYQQIVYVCVCVCLVFKSTCVTLLGSLTARLSPPSHTTLRKAWRWFTDLRGKPKDEASFSWESGAP